MASTREATSERKRRSAPNACIRPTANSATKPKATSATANVRNILAAKLRIGSRGGDGDLEEGAAMDRSRERRARLIRSWDGLLRSGRRGGGASRPLGPPTGG